MNRSEVLRGMLANVGIKIDDPPQPPTVRQPQPIDEIRHIANRERIREILIELGAPGSDLEWLVASCPDIKTAKTYRPQNQGSSE